MHPADFDPVPGRAEQIAPGLRRMLAPNPGPMTWRGTNTYILGWRGLAVIDPGPDDPAHLDAILASVGPGQRISHILVTHAHSDHSPLARKLAQATGAPVLAHGDARAGRSHVMDRLHAGGLPQGGEGVDCSFIPDVTLPDRTAISGDDWSLTAHWTPGHMGNHMVFAWGDALFSGDLVMGWSSSLVSPPDGDMAAFFASCDRLAALRARVFHPGHGAPVTETAARLTSLIAHRRAREAQICAALADRPGDLADLTRRVYGDITPALLPAAARNALAHLIDLHERGTISARPELGEAAIFAMTRTDRKKTTDGSGRSGKALL
jgi:glyoxylase-like metal-dependent hydrolase (beta-lactamase superfamily II)